MSPTTVKGSCSCSRLLSFSKEILAKKGFFIKKRVFFKILIFITENFIGIRDDSH